MQGVMFVSGEIPKVGVVYFGAQTVELRGESCRSFS